MADKMMTFKEVATLMQVEPRTVQRWIQLQRLKAVRIGRTTRIRHSDLLRAMEKYEDGGGERHDAAMG